MNIDVRDLLKVVKNYEVVLRESDDAGEVLEAWEVGHRAELMRLGELRVELLNLLAAGTEDI